MKKTFEFNLKYWNGAYKKERRYEYDTLADGTKVLTDRYKLVTLKDTKDIEKIKVNPNNDVVVKCIDEKPFILKTGEIMLNVYKIDPLRSAFINQWNITLPLIAYKEDNNNGNDSEI